MGLLIRSIGATTDLPPANAIPAGTIISVGNDPVSAKNAPYRTDGTQWINILTGVPLPPPGPTATRPAMDAATTVWWKFIESELPVANFGSLGADYSLPAASGSITPAQPGLYGPAVYFDGSNGSSLYRDPNFIGAAPSDNTGPFTVLATITPQAEGFVVARSWWSGTFDFVYGIAQRPGASPSKLNADFYFRGYTGMETFSYNGFDFAYGVPTVLAMTLQQYAYDNQPNLKCYINGTPVISEMKLTNNFAWPNSQGQQLVGTSGVSPFPSMKGLVHDIRMLSRVMSPAEILAFSNTALGKG